MLAVADVPFAAAVRRRSAARAIFHRPIVALLLLLAILTPSPCCPSAEIDRIFLSGVADTAQIFRVVAPVGGEEFGTSGDGNSETTTITTWRRQRHLVCFHRGGKRGVPYAWSIAAGRMKCCNELYQNGLIESDERNYCSDRVAKVPENAIAVGRKASLMGNVMPAFYLALGEGVTNGPKEKASSMDQTFYNQNRRLKVLEDKEKAIFRDGYNGGVGSYSPFHLAGFMSAGGIDDGRNGSPSLPLRGDARGTLSKEGGMHRNFHQTVHLSLDVPSRSSDSYVGHQLDINATILLPIMESIFIDADDPLLVEYDGVSFPDGISCKVSTIGGEITIASKCDIDFFHPETIDIEQPSFASRQYVVAYQISAMMDFSLLPSEIGSERELEIAIDYGTTLHIRYPSPILGDAATTINGLVPISIQHPVVFSASASLRENDKHDESNVSRYFERESDARPPPNPIIIHVAAGMDGDSWWVTAITMSSALIGGLMLMKSLDLVSMWC
mmetsp:Transcript_13258/g.32220  ORF Transcript_13258/g.32220 Transcript_13258/m.32220 type:complete len:500 (+) Transcript_13258:96-1595(+)